jgi:hypothetical protein
MEHRLWVLLIFNAEIIAEMAETPDVSAMPSRD